jgi:hypothetical protein
MIPTSKKIKSHIKTKEKKRSIRFKRKPLPGFQEGHYDNTNIIKQDIQPKSILTRSGDLSSLKSQKRTQQSSTVFKNDKQELKSSLPSKEVKTKHKSNITQLNKI